jgi:DNA-binding SARP family transcriptional activator
LHRDDQIRFVTAGSPPSDDEPRIEPQSIDSLALDLEEEIVRRQGSGITGAAPIVALANLAGDGLADLTRLDTVLHRGPEYGIFTICLSHDPIDISNTVGARASVGGDEGPDELTLVIQRDPPIILQRVEVRAQPLRGRPQFNPTPAQVQEPGDGFEPPVDIDLDSPESVEPSFARSKGAATFEDEMAAPLPPEPAYVPKPEPAPAMHEASVPVQTPVISSRQPALMVVEEPTPAAEAAEEHATFEVRCFGPFQVFREDTEISGWTIQKARELLAYLVARGGTRVTREEAADALWPEAPADEVGHLLSNAAYYVRKTLRGALTSPNGRLLTISEQRYLLQPGAFRVDLDAFDAHLRRAESLEGSEALIEYDRALSIYRSDFLAGEPFEWAEPFRRDYQRRFTTAAHQAGRLALECRDVKRAMDFYQAILDRDPIDEEAARSVMRCHAKLGDVNGVRRAYKTLQESLKRELEDDKAEPMPETVALLSTLTS